MKIMKTKMIDIKDSRVLSVLLILLISSVSIMAQEAVATRLSLSVTQMPEAKAYLQARMLGRVDGRYTPISKKEISFYSVTEDEPVVLGTATTNAKGIATIQIEDIKSLGQDEDNYFNFSAAYEGDESFEGSDDQIAMLQANISYELESDDESTKMMVTAIADDEESTPLADYEIVMSVPRMFSNLKIGEGYTDEEGKMEFTIPEGIPGDEQGNLDVKVRVIDAGDYGNLELAMTQPWGVPRHEVVSANRQLWSPDAPLWIVITFATLMIAVWSHFVIVILQLYKMSKIGS